MKPLGTDGTEYAPLPDGTNVVKLPDGTIRLALPIPIVASFEGEMMGTLSVRLEKRKAKDGENGDD